MYELGVVIHPNDLLDLAMKHNRSAFPLDSKPRGYSIDEQCFYVVFDSQEDLGSRPIPLEAKDGEFRVGGPLLVSPLPNYHAIGISWGTIFKIMKRQIEHVPRDAELLHVHVWQGNDPKDTFHIFRLYFRTHHKETLQFSPEGKPQDFYFKPPRVNGEVTGELKFVGVRAN